MQRDGQAANSLFPPRTPTNSRDSLVKAERAQERSKRVKVHHLTLLCTAITILSIFFAFSNIFFRSLNNPIDPLVIAHRGLDGGNGVENTLQSLVKTVRGNPDYVEIDIRETKDGHWVLMHDANLKRLTGIDARTSDYTLKQLTALTVTQYGHSTHPTSFDEYLDTAEKLHQKLVVEIKASRTDSDDAYADFFDKYAHRLLQAQDLFHSFSSEVVETAKEKAPDLFTSLILRKEFSFSSTTADAYSARASQLDSNFISSAATQHKAVWAWTINNTTVMRRMLSLKVDGIITDEMSALRKIMQIRLIRLSLQPAFERRLRKGVMRATLVQ